MNHFIFTIKLYFTKIRTETSYFTSNNKILKFWFSISNAILKTQNLNKFSQFTDSFLYLNIFFHSRKTRIKDHDEVGHLKKRPYSSTIIKSCSKLSKPPTI